MSEKINSNPKTNLTRLNEIADKWADTKKHPAESSKTLVQELGKDLYDQLEDRVNTVVTETPLTRREAEVWVLENTVDEHCNLLTEDAMALLLSAPNTGFGDATDSDEVRATRQPVTEEEIRQLTTAAKKKYEDARQTIGALTFPDRHDTFTSPILVWLDHQTVQRLKSRRHSDENTLDEVVTRSLAESETRRSLESFVRGYLNARGKDNVAQLAIEQQTLDTGALHITAHTAVQEDLPDIITETDAITYNGHRYDFYFDESQWGPYELGRITLYASDTIIGMDETQLENGLVEFEKHVQELLENEKPMPDCTVE